MEPYEGSCAGQNHRAGRCCRSRPARLAGRPSHGRPATRPLRPRESAVRGPPPGDRYHWRESQNFTASSSMPTAFMPNEPLVSTYVLLQSVE